MGVDIWEKLDHHGLILWLNGRFAKWFHIFTLPFGDILDSQTSISPRVVSKVVLILDRHSLFRVSLNEISVQTFL